MQDAMPDCNQEVWKPVVGYESFYEVSSLGRVRRLVGANSTFAGRILSVRAKLRGYPSVGLYSGSGRSPRNVTVHRLVASAFIGPRPLGFHVNHIDGCKTNNQLSNLEYLSDFDNRQHAIALGLLHTKVTPDDVRAIRARYAEIRNQRLVALEFGIARSNVSLIVNRKAWAHVP